MSMHRWCMRFNERLRQRLTPIKRQSAYDKCVWSQNRWISDGPTATMQQCWFFWLDFACNKQIKEIKNKKWRKYEEAQISRVYARTVILNKSNNVILIIIINSSVMTSLKQRAESRFRRWSKQKEAESATMLLHVMPNTTIIILNDNAIVITPLMWFLFCYSCENNAYFITLHETIHFICYIRTVT